MVMLSKSVYLAVVLLAVLAAFPYQALPFMTFSGFGGAIHGAILKDALAPLKVKKNNIAFIRKGTDSQDIPLTHKFAACPQNHCDDNKIQEGHAYWSSKVAQAVAEAKDAHKSRAVACKVLFEFGEGMQTVQDYYAHSNYVEWLIQNNLPLDPVDWDNVPPAIRTGYYYYGGLIDNDSFCKRERAILQLKKQTPALRFHSDTEFSQRKKTNSYAEALNYVLFQGDLLHRELNKDGSRTMQGRIVIPARGKTLHILARQLATADTARQWIELERQITSRYKDDAARIISALKGGH